MRMTAPVRLTVASSSAFELLDLSDQVGAVVASAAAESGVVDGIAHVFCPHTSCGLAITELEDGLHRDFERVLSAIAPVDAEWAHDDLAVRYQNLEPDERRNGWSHIRALLGTSPSVSVPVLDGALALGRWQRLFLVELDGPRPQRSVIVQSWGRPGSVQEERHG
jgi:secondary thiamine-phosphate synthase enzyme